MKTKLWLFLLCLALTYVACRKENNFSISETETSQQQDWSSSSRNAAYGHPFLDYRWPADWTDVGYDWLGQKPQTLDVVKQSMQAFEQDHPGVLNLIDEGIGRPVWEALTEVVFDESDGIELDVTALPLIDPDKPLLTGLIFSVQSPGQDMRFLIAKTDDIDAFQDTTQLEEDLRGLLPAMGLFAQSYREWFFPEQRRAQSRGDCLWPWDGVKCPSAAGGKSRFKKWFAGLVGSGGNGPSGGKSQTTVITSSSSWVFLLAGGNSNIPDGERNTGGGSKYDEFCHKPKEELNFEDITRLMETMTEMITRGELSEMPQNVFHVARADCFEEGVDFGACLRASYVCEIREEIQIKDEALECIENNTSELIDLYEKMDVVGKLISKLQLSDCSQVKALMYNQELLEAVSEMVGSEPLNQEGKAALRFAIQTIVDGQWTSTSAEGTEQAIAENWPITPVNTAATYGQLLGEVAYLKLKYADEIASGDKTMAAIWMEASWRVWKGTIHTVLDICGFAFFGCDGANAVFYLLEGDNMNAAISTAALVPIVGWTATGGRLVKAITGAAGRAVHLRFATDAAGRIFFGDRGQLARVIGKLSGHQVHHIIPWGLGSHDAIQMAASKGWHMNDALNGMNLPLARHSGSHPNFNNAVQEKLDELKTLVNQGNSSLVFQKVSQFTANLRRVIDNNPQLHINDPTLADLIGGISIL
ncbi:MAG: AHH domain-containing protein [Bacteroidota bacterium]